MAKAKKFYAVRKGKVPGLFLTWEDCRDSVYGYPGAEYKSFPTMEEAGAYLSGGLEDGSAASGSAEGVNAAKTAEAAQTTRTAETGKTAKAKKAVKAKKEEQERPQAAAGELIAYVDGSYHALTGEFSYGAVLLLPEEDVCLSQKYDDPALAEMHNVAGEIKGAEAAVQYALEHGYTKVIIHHDYEGIAKWCLGLWKTNKEGTKAYKAFYDSVKGRINIEFVKVKGHSNDKYNDMADKLAKKALGI